MLRSHERIPSRNPARRLTTLREYELLTGKVTSGLTAAVVWQQISAVVVGVAAEDVLDV